MESYQRETANTNNWTSVLEFTGCDNCERLIAERDKIGDDSSVKQMLTEDRNEEENEGMIAALCGESVFYKGGQAENDGLKNEDV